MGWRRWLLALVCLWLIGCGGDPPPDSGYVREKKYTPAHWEDGYRTVTYTDCGLHYDYQSNGYKHSCQPATKQVYESRHHWVDDAWSLYLENCDERDDKGKPKCKKGWRRVDETTFHDYRVGQHFPDPR